MLNLQDGFGIGLVLGWHGTGQSTISVLENKKTFIYYCLILVHFIMYGVSFDILFNVDVTKYLGERSQKS